MDEQWEPIGDTGYFVSNTGKVASTKKGWLVLKPRKTKMGYRRACLYDGGLGRDHYIHRLVADAFLGLKPTPQHEINHIDGNKTNNAVSNLEWMTPSENIRHSYCVLGRKASRGEAAGRARLTENAVREIRRRRRDGEMVKTLAGEFGVSGPTITNISNRQSWEWLV